jgi:DNA-directed RNA polymerase specialized sigma24 family protein
VGPCGDDGDEPGGDPGGAAPEAERLADARIVEKLRECGFDGPEWRAVAAGLMEYGYTILVVWACTGTLGRHAADHGGVSGSRVPVDLRLDEDEARSLAAEVLLVAVERFRERSLPRWSAGGGASLRTWFVGRCLMELADVHRAWRNRELPLEPVGITCVDDGRHGDRPDEQAEARVELERLLTRDPDLCRAVRLQIAGYKLEEIAKMMGTTPAGVRSQIYRGRRRIEKEGPQ